MAKKLPEFSKVRMIGQPYHGLWQAGTITLPNNATKSAPTPANGGVVLIRVPGQPAVTRTTAEQAADAAAGLEWRNYALISGGYYGGMGPLYTNSSYAYIIFVDAAKVRWLMRIYTSQEMTNAMTVALRRLGHIDGTTATWSSDITVSIPADFVTSVNSTVVPLMTIAQNTTGREFVVGSVPGGSFATALLKVEATGTVDINAANYGLSFTATTLEYENRLNNTLSNSSSVTGTCINVFTTNYEQRLNSNNQPTGVTYAAVNTYTDGALTTNGPPPSVAGCSWAQISTFYTRSTNKTTSGQSGYAAKRYVWAAYVEDALKIYSIEYTQVSAWSGSASWVTTPGQNPAGPNGDWQWFGTTTQTRSLISKIDNIVVHDETWTVTSGPYNDYCGTGVWGLNFAEQNKDGYATNTTQTLTTKASIDNIIHDGRIVIDNGGGSYTYKAIYMLPVSRLGARWTTPLVALCTSVSTSAAPNTYTFTTQSVWAPTGTNVATTIHINNLFATWHPVTDDLRVSTQNICWF